jgi:Tfp pilus assembly protein PilN
VSRRPDFSTRPLRRPRPIDVALLGVAVLSAALAANAARSAWAEQRRRAQAVEGLRREVGEARVRAQLLESQGGLEEGLAAQVLASSEAPPPRVLADLVGVLPREVRLDGFSLSYGPRLEVELQVVARSAAAYDTFLERLAASPVFRDVLPGPETREGELRASVRASYRRGGGR